ncbi:hypothetical protein D1B33_08185 [Lysinibacillus yapensis]|uniref:Uncharacterized protein n=1 Tax=Ureibacillus yapensis TaxID=2304605 RepID=A0A396S8U3_9BACL|nr:hypothetical protein [Lysinibacillus yapensis]RHW37505.1 hypothetical protein D1B33_08185 [Lysinibacillus yapensis]
MKVQSKPLRTQTITITLDELNGKDTSTALEIYENKLKREPDSYYRNVHIEFVNDTKNGMRVIRKNELIEPKVQWYRKLLEEQPGFLYFFAEEDFTMYMYMAIHNFRPLTLSYLVKKKQINLNQPVKVDNQLKNYILESLEDLSKSNSAAPINLMYQVYQEVAGI